MCFDNDSGDVEMASSAFRTARRDHKCGWCHRPIAKGHQYQSYSGKFDGAFFETKLCNLCYQDSVHVVRVELSEGCSWYDAWPSDYDSMLEWIEDHPGFERAKEHVDFRILKAELP